MCHSSFRSDHYNYNYLFVKLQVDDLIMGCDKVEKNEFPHENRVELTPKGFCSLQ